MIEQKIKCPNCGNEFNLTDGFIDLVRDELTGEIDRKIKKKYEEENLLVISDLHDQLKSKSEQLDTLKKNELDLRRRQRELEEKEKDIDLEIERKIDNEKRIIEQTTEKRILEKIHLKDLEKDKKIDDFEKKVKELQQKIDQGSQQLKGEVAELEIESLLKIKFPSDEFEPVEKGKKGGDIIQKIIENGKECGSIIWETKNTKNWSDGWIAKLKEDQRSVKADLAVIISMALPKDVDTFECIDDIWVTNFSLATKVAVILRSELIEIESMRLANEGKDKKINILYDYLCGNEFKQRISGMMEAFKDMQSELDRERQAINQLWARREKQIEKFVLHMSGMYGDIKGIIGKGLPEIESLELPLLTEGEDAID